jgi:hypothetical protein
MKIEFAWRDLPPGLRMDGTYELEPVIEGGDMLSDWPERSP